MSLEAEAGAHNVFAQDASFVHLLNRITQTVNGNGVLSTDIEITFGSANGVTGDHHTFNNGIGIAFQNGAIHKCAGVTFVTVADHILLVSSIGCSKRPLPAGGETCAATATQASSQNLVDNFLRLHGKSFLQTLECTVTHCFIDVFGVDDTAAMERNTLLLLVEVDVLLLGNLLTGVGLHIQQALDDLTAHNILLKDFVYIVQGNQTIQSIFGENLHEGTLRAETEATNDVDGHLVLQAILCNQLLKLGLDIHGVGGDTTGTAAEQNSTLAVTAVHFGGQRIGATTNLLIEFSKILHLLALLSQILIHNTLDCIHSHLGVDLAVNGNSRSNTASADAAQCIDGKQTVSGSLTGLYTQDLGEFVDDLLSALNITSGAQAAADDVLALRLQRKEGIEGDNTVDLSNRDTGLLGNDLLDLQRNVAVLVLDITEDHHQRSLFTDVTIADLIDLLDTGLIDMCHCLPPFIYLTYRIHICPSAKYKVC